MKHIKLFILFAVTVTMSAVSGPNAMVDSFKGVLRDLGIKNAAVKTDFFPGFT